MNVYPTPSHRIFPFETYNVVHIFAHCLQKNPRPLLPIVQARVDNESYIPFAALCRHTDT